MNTFLSSIALVSLMSVSGVQRVPGFTPTNTTAIGARDLSSPHAVSTYVAAHDDAPHTRECAPNMTVSAAHARVVETMLSQSPTFRRQCERLTSAPNLSVAIYGHKPGGTQAAAVTSIRRRPFGRLEAHVYLHPSPDVPRLIAHELEHVIEQLDGVNLAVKASIPGSGVRRTSDRGMFETRRATVRGLRVAREVVDRTW
jgi:hypothetical protein